MKHDLLRSKKHSFSYYSKEPSKKLNSSVLFPEIQKELAQVRISTVGLFIIQVLKNKEKREEWYLLFQGKDTAPSISQQKPLVKRNIPIVLIQIEDSILLNFITGGLTGLSALNQKKLKIVGDLELAQELESLFSKAGGVEKTLAFLRKSKL